VKPYVKSHKNDTTDAAAIAEAVTRTTMRFVQVKQPEQVDLQSLHRIRDQMVGSRTRLIYQMSPEYGVAIRQGAGLFKSDLPRVIADEWNDMTPTMRRLLNELFEDLMRLEKRIAEVTREIEALAASDEKARRLMTIPGIGPLGATALLAAAGNGQQFKKARDMAAWLGPVPQQYSTEANPDVWHRQAREPLPSKAFDTWCEVMRHAPRSIARPIGEKPVALTPNFSMGPFNEYGTAARLPSMQIHSLEPRQDRTAEPPLYRPLQARRAPVRT
jgi:hypothetical protein